MGKNDFTEEERQRLLDRIAMLEDERNRRLHAEEAMAEARNRADEEFARMRIFQDFIGEALTIHDKQDLIERSLEVVIEAFETEAAAFFTVESDGKIRLAGRFGLEDLEENLTISLAGDTPEKAVLFADDSTWRSFTESLKLKQGMLCPFKGLETEFGGIIVTGNSAAGVGIYQKPIRDHLSSFSVLCAQIGAIWSELLYKEQKVEYAHQLEDRVRERTVELKEAQEHFLQLLEAAPDGFVVVDTDGKITFTNAQTEILFGYTKEQMFGKQVEMLVPPHLRVKHAAFREKYFKAPRIRPMGVELSQEACRADGSIFPVEISLSPIKTNQGIQSVAAVRDISERKEADEELKRNMDALERFRNIAVGRETRMIRLKEEINKLRIQFGQDPKYKIVDKQDTEENGD